MGVGAPPDQPNRHRRGVAEAAEHHALAPVLREGALGGHADAAARGDDGEPVVDVVDLLDGEVASGRPQLRGGSRNNADRLTTAGGMLAAQDAAAAPTTTVILGAVDLATAHLRVEGFRGTTLAAARTLNPRSSRGAYASAVGTTCRSERSAMVTTTNSTAATSMNTASRCMPGVSAPWTKNTPPAVDATIAPR